MIETSEGYTLTLTDNFCGSTVTLLTDQDAPAVVEALSRAMVALTFDSDLVKRSLKIVAKEI